MASPSSLPATVQQIGLWLGAYTGMPAGISARQRWTGATEQNLHGRSDAKLAFPKYPRDRQRAAPAPRRLFTRRTDTDVPPAVRPEFRRRLLAAEGEHWQALHVTLGYGFAGLFGSCTPVRGPGERLLNEWFSASTSRHAQTASTVDIDWVHNTEDFIMKLTLLLATVGVLAMGISTSSLADAREQDRYSRASAGFDRGMQVVTATASPGQPGHAWRYFSDPAAGRAVVISPQGEYYFNGGNGLSLVALAQPRR